MENSLESNDHNGDTDNDEEENEDNTDDNDSKDNDNDDCGNVTRNRGHTPKQPMKLK